MTESARQAIAILRDPSQFQWTIVPILVIAIYIYNVEIAKKNWKAVLAGLAFWGMDWFNEIWNALVLHFSGYAPVWGAPGHTSFLILVGLNIEISLMFLMAGIVAVQGLPEDRDARILGIPNRLFLASLWSAFAVVVEMLLHAAGALTWDYSWWNVDAPYLIFLFGYMPFFVVAYWVHDMPTIRRQVLTVAAIYVIDVAALIVFGVLGWI